MTFASHKLEADSEIALCKERKSVGISKLLFHPLGNEINSQYIQLIIIPIVFTLVGFVGIAVTSAGEVLYGQTLWDPTKLIDQWDNRAAAFFASFSFALASLGTNISANRHASFLIYCN